MQAAILKQLITAHASGDDDAFRKAALQLAGAESAAGHKKIAAELRDLIDAQPSLQRGSGQHTPIDIARPRKDLAGLLEGGYVEADLGDIVLRPDARGLFERIIAENRHRRDLEQWAVAPRRKLLFYGPPGCGKTLAGRVLAGELGLPLMTVRIDALFSRYLGETASQLRAIFDELPRRPAVYLFDEFDAVGKVRGDLQDVGEIRRVVVSFLQLMDSDSSPSLIVAATNDESILDPAVFRRFDVLLAFHLPSVEDIAELIRKRLHAFALSDSDIVAIASTAAGLSFADVARVCDDAIRSMALAKRKNLQLTDLADAVDAAATRARPNSEGLGSERPH